MKGTGDCFRVEDERRDDSKAGCGCVSVGLLIEGHLQWGYQS